MTEGRDEIAVAAVTSEGDVKEMWTKNVKWLWTVWSKHPSVTWILVLLGV